MARKARFVVALSQPVPAGCIVTVNYSTSNDTAVSPSDYTAQSGQLVFTQGQQYKNVDILVRDSDTDSENGLVQREKFNLVLSNPQTVGSVIATISNPSTRQASLPLYSFLERFRWTYNKIQDPSNGYYTWGRLILNA